MKASPKKFGIGPNALSSNNDICIMFDINGDAIFDVNQHSNSPRNS